MHITNYREKKANKIVSFEFAESGRIAVIERRHDELTGKPIMKPTQETDSKEMAETIAETQKQIDHYTELLADQKALAADIKAMEDKAAQYEEKATK